MKKRCQNGTRKNKKTGKCKPYKSSRLPLKKTKSNKSVEKKLSNNFSKKRDLSKKYNYDKVINYKNVLYYAVTFDDKEYGKLLKEIYKNKIFSDIHVNSLTLSKEENKLISSFNPNDKIKIITLPDSKNKIIYKLNEHIHITILFVGKKENENAHKIEPFINSPVNCVVTRYAISEKFIVAEVKFKNNDFEVPYFGNKIMHITIGLRQSLDKKNKVFPKDSPTAFKEGTVYELEKEIPLTGTISVM